jgi:hypothetical protein
MFAPVTYPERLEPLVQTIEDSRAGDIVETVLGELRRGRSPGELMLAAALAAARSTDVPAVHHGGVLHPIAGLHAVRHMAARLEGRWGLLPVIQHVALTNRHVHFTSSGPFILPAAEPLGVGDSLEETLAALAGYVRNGEYHGSDRCFLHLLQALPPMQVLEHLLQVATPKATRDDHNLLYPVLTWRVLDHFGWEYAKFLVRPAVRFVTRLPGPRDDFEKFDALIDEHGLLRRELRIEAGEDETRAIASLGEGIGRVAAMREIRSLLARALAGGLSLQGAGEALSLGASRLFLRSRTGDWMEVHANTTANVQRYLMRQPEVSVHTKLRALLAWDAGPDTRLLQRRLGPDLRPDPGRVASLGFRSQDALLADIEDRLTSLPAQPAPERPLEGEDELDLLATMTAQYGRCGHDPAALIETVGKIVCRDQSTEMHAYKHHQATCEEFYDTRPALRWTHLVAAVQGAALCRRREERTFRDAAARLGLPVTR